jgi:hypothetical protein
VVFYDLSAVYLTDFPSHPVTQGLEGIAVLFTVTRSITPQEDSDATRLAETSADGWGESNLNQLLAGEPVAKDDVDTPGPVAVGVAIEGSPVAPAAESAEEDVSEGDGFRLVVFGDSDFLTDFEISNAGNLTLAMNAVNWLVVREHVLGIAPRQIEQVSLFLSQQQLRTILLITLLIMPGAAIVLGVLVWRRRRH